MSPEASPFSIVAIINRVIANWLLAALPVSRFYSIKRRLLNQSGINVGIGGKINGGTRFYGRGYVSIGTETWVGPNCCFYTHHDVPILIGRNCDIAPDVRFVTGSHEIGPAVRRAGTGCAKAIQIGDGCWVGVGVTLLGGVKIGRGSILAAGSVVTKDVPEDCVAAGVPARVIRKLGSMG